MVRKISCLHTYNTYYTVQREDLDDKTVSRLYNQEAHFDVCLYPLKISKE
jgi:hypothetical protein